MLSSDRISDVIDNIADLRNKVRELNEQVKDLTAQETELQTHLMSLLELHGMKRASNAHFTVSLNETQVPTVTDWDAFYEYIYSNNAAYLLERRPSAKPYRDLLEQGVEIPGVIPFVRRSLTFKTL